MRLLVLAWIICSAAQSAARASGQGAPPRPPNVVLIMADDLGWGDPGYQGGPCRTPQLDRLAREGVNLRRFYAAAPVCSPTRGSVLTGRHPYRYGITGANVGHLPVDELTLAEELGAAGYATGFFGKWHLGTLTTEVRDSNRGGRPKHAAHFNPPTRHGFDISFCTEAKVPTFEPLVHPETGAPYGTRYWIAAGSDSPREATGNLTGDDSRVITDRAIPFIEGAVARGKPFLAVVWLHAPHLPVVAGPADRELYPGATDEGQRYRGCISALDREVGRLRGTLARLAVAEDTLLLFCSDNGPEARADNGSNGRTGGLRGRKRSLYEGGVRVPGLAIWPAGGLRGGRVVDAPCSTLDILPSVRAACGLQAPQPGSESEGPELDGIDALPLWAGARAERGAPLLFRSGKMRTRVGDRFKLVLRGERAELYDLGEDPGEERDLAADQPERVARWSAELEAWCERVDADRVERESTASGR